MFCISDISSAVTAAYYVCDSVLCNKERARVTGAFLRSAEPLILQVTQILTRS